MTTEPKSKIPMTVTETGAKETIVGKAKADIDADPWSVNYALGELEGTGEWRAMKAAEYPDDNRNSWATECCRKGNQLGGEYQ